MFVFEKRAFHNHKSFERVPFNTQTKFGVTPCLAIREYGGALIHLFTNYFILLRSQNFCISIFDGLRCKTVHTMLLLRQGFWEIPIKRIFRSNLYWDFWFKFQIPSTEWKSSYGLFLAQNQSLQYKGKSLQGLFSQTQSLQDRCKSR